MKENQRVIAQIRSFNRYYTVLIGLLDDHLLNSEYSLTEARILYEIYHGGAIRATEIMTLMPIDKGYLSRLLKRLEKNKLIVRKASEQDARASLISLTEKGEMIFNSLNEASNRQIDELIQPLPAPKRQELVEHMQAIMNILKK